MVRLRQPIRQVALLVEWSRAYGRGVLRGIGKYVQTHGRWEVYHTERNLSDTAPSWLRKWKGDGIIARIENPRLAGQIKRMQIPFVDLYEHEGKERLSTVLTDNGAIARLAAGHLIERELKHFAYCGLPGIFSSDERCRCFVEYLSSVGYDVHVYEPSHRHPTKLISANEDFELRREAGIVRWLHALPKPIGLMACNDLRAHQILMVCDENRLAVPEEVAVIGVDNDEVICGLTRPPLSSVEQNPEEVGYQAAALLDRLMQGETPPKEPMIIPPRGIVARQSTDIVAVADAELASALHHIRKHACDGLSVGELAKSVAMSRRTLERRFLQCLGRSPKDEIDRVQLGHVKRLLATTDYPLVKIAQLTGFRYVESMCALFKKTIAQTPGQYRRRHPANSNELSE